MPVETSEEKARTEARELRRIYRGVKLIRIIETEIPIDSNPRP